ncbi:hypothetical protein ACG02S_07910 [Roseateles sp. DC23W]|uniref:Holin-X, holin superfamily III n=1 Tax=Pelomonas dachongensis TaxID=3299029 RepID=A0ABW7EKC9_9BURK
MQLLLIALAQVDGADHAARAVEAALVDQTVDVEAQERDAQAAPPGEARCGGVSAQLSAGFGGCWRVDMVRAARANVVAQITDAREAHMRFVLFLTFLAACSMAVIYGLFATGPYSAVLGALWTLIALVAGIGRAVLDALRPQGDQPQHEGGGGAKMPAWLDGGTGQK